MDDNLDIAAEREELARQAAIAARRPAAPAPIGACLYCGERLPAPMRWCNADHRNEWQELNPKL